MIRTLIQRSFSAPRIASSFRFPPASACEVDIAGVVSTCALQLATGKPSALVDWNNNYGDAPDKCVLFHCGNWAKDFLPDIRIGTAPILGTMLGEENTVGALEGRTPSGPMTVGRISTDDVSGRIRAYVGEGSFTDDPLDTVWHPGCSRDLESTWAHALCLP